MRKVIRKLTNRESVRLLTIFLYRHIDDGGVMPVKVTLERWTNKRSMGQNALLHVWFADIAAHIGDDPKSVKSDLKHRLAPQVEGPTGVMRPMDTHEMTVPVMDDFMQNIKALGVDQGWELTNAA